MGIVNLTDDSFYSGSRYGSLSSQEVVAVVEKMFEDGASIVDIGACSSRPGAEPIPPKEEWRRLERVLKELAGKGLTLSVDTTSSETVCKVFDTIGDFIINDISAGSSDPRMLPLAGSLGLPYVAMHMRGQSSFMDSLTNYPMGVTATVMAYFRDFSAKASDYGISDWILDPGFGFAKTVTQNWEILGNLHEFKTFGRPILVGISRKSMLWRPLGITPEESLPATEVANLLALQEGASILRVHDVPDAVRTVKLFELYTGTSPTAGNRHR